MVASTSLLQSASSSDGSAVAVVPPTSSSSSRHLIQIYHVSGTSTSLQLTLTHTSKLPLTELSFVGNSVVLGLFGRQKVVVWDLHRGVVATTISATDEQSFLTMASPLEGMSNYYILVRYGPKLLIHEYESNNHKLVRKIKSGHFLEEDDNDDIDTRPKLVASLVVTKSYFAVRTRDGGVRVMAKDTGKKVGRIQIKASGVGVADDRMDMTVCRGDSNVVATVQDLSATTVLYDLESCKEIARVPPQNTENNDGDFLCLQMVELGGKFAVLLHNSLLSIKQSDSLHDLRTRFASERPVALFLRSGKILALISNRGAECTARWIQYSGADGEDENVSLPDVIHLDIDDEEIKTEITASSKKKRVAETTVLGPGQAGGEASTSVKKLKVSNDEDDESVGANKDENGDKHDDIDIDEVKNMTIAERLQMLKEALEEEDEDDEEMDRDDDDAVDIVTADKTTISFKPKKATTESLKELLSQALQSSDDNLLELALTVRDVMVIATTLKELDRELLVILLGKLTSRLASSPLRAESLSVWISHCLKRGTFNPEHLSVLRNLLYERIESFADLLRLEGRLSMMVD